MRRNNDGHRQRAAGPVTFRLRPGLPAWNMKSIIRDPEGTPEAR
jgi:hypothetical protein